MDFFTSRLVKSFLGQLLTILQTKELCKRWSGLIEHVKLLLTDNKTLFIHMTIVGSSLVHATKSMP